MTRRNLFRSLFAAIAGKVVGKALPAAPQQTVMMRNGNVVCWIEEAEKIPYKTLHGLSYYADSPFARAPYLGISRWVSRSELANKYPPGQKLLDDLCDDLITHGTAAVRIAHRLCKCGHTIDDHSWEVAGSLKPWCDECCCKCYQPTSDPQSETTSTTVSAPQSDSQTPDV